MGKHGGARDTSKTRRIRHFIAKRKGANAQHIFLVVRAEMAGATVHVRLEKESSWDWCPEHSHSILPRRYSRNYLVFRIAQAHEKHTKKVRPPQEQEDGSSRLKLSLSKACMPHGQR
jgi:hypothetical protein